MASYSQQVHLIVFSVYGPCRHQKPSVLMDSAARRSHASNTLREALHSLKSRQAFLMLVSLGSLACTAWNSFALPNPDRERQIAKFNAAVEAGAVSEVRAMLRSRNKFGLANAWKRGEPPLYLASEQGHAELVHLLLRAQADPDRGSIYDDASPLNAASAKGNAEIVRMLLAAGADSNAGCDFYMSPPLFDASEQGHAEVVRLLLEYRAERDQLGEYSMGTPLEAATAKGHVEVARLLLAGAEMDGAGLDTSTPLAVACRQGHMEIARLLLESGADTDLLSGDAGRDITTPLHEAVRQGHTEIARLLLEAGADTDLGPQLESWQGDDPTPLQSAAQSGDTEMMRLLLEACALKEPRKLEDPQAAVDPTGAKDPET